MDHRRRSPIPTSGLRPVAACVCDCHSEPESLRVGTKVKNLRTDLSQRQCLRSFTSFRMTLDARCFIAKVRPVRGYGLRTFGDPGEGVSLDGGESLGSRRLATAFCEDGRVRHKLECAGVRAPSQRRQATALQEPSWRAGVSVFRAPRYIGATRAGVMNHAHTDRHRRLSVLMFRGMLGQRHERS